MPYQIGHHIATMIHIICNEEQHVSSDRFTLISAHVTSRDKCTVSPVLTVPPPQGVENVMYHNDKNVYLDVILQDLYRDVGDRHIILCSFCVDICTM
jgi:hypothetical protein